MSEYAIQAVVRRVGVTRKIEWTYDGRGSGTLAWNAWRRMRATNQTMDTREPFVGAAILRDGKLIEAIGTLSP
jgi:hypothetical protein